jgi:hypothetical protein
VVSLGRKILEAQLANKRLGLGPLGDPPPFLALTEAEIRAWHDIVAAAVPGVLASPDALAMGVAAADLAAWRSGQRSPDDLRNLVAWLDEHLIPHAARAKLLAPACP